MRSETTKRILSETPPEPREFEIEKVMLGEEDITELLDNSYKYVKPTDCSKPWAYQTKLEELEELILETL